MDVVAEPWVERHRPRRLDDLIGNPQCVSELRAWAEAWKAGRPRQRVVILAGPPGSGKTTAAHALAAEMAWQVVELNASDARNATAIQRVAGVGAVHQTFSLTGEFRSSTRGELKLIILDEADNLYERAEASTGEDGQDLSDRGGKRAIADTVAQTHQPIILIVNDAYALTKGSGDRIAKAALKITFRRVGVASVKKLLREIAAREGVAVSDDALQALAARAEGDLRSAINDLEAVSAGNTKVDSVTELQLGARQRSQSAFDAVAAVLKSGDARRAIDAARDLDEPPDFLLAWIDENLPVEYRDPRDLARAYEALSRADVFLGRTRRRQQFGLWGYATELMAGGVAAAKTRHYGTPPMYRFPGWIRRMGASKGSRGARDRLAEKLGRRLHMGAEAVLRESLAPIRRLVRHDPAFAESLAWTAELEEDEIRALFGQDAPARLADEVVAHVEARRAAAAKGQAHVAAHEPAKPAKASRARGTSLGDF
jgi:replication factor C large subunit